MGNSNSHSSADTEASIYLNPGERTTLKANYEYLCRMLNASEKSGIPVHKLKSSRILPPFIIKGLLAPARLPNDLSNTSTALKDDQTFRYHHMLLAACRVARSSGVEQATVCYEAGDLENQSLCDWVAQMATVGLDAWRNRPRQQGDSRWGSRRRSSSDDLSDYECGLVTYLLLYPQYQRERSFALELDDSQTAIIEYQRALHDWRDQCQISGAVKLAAFRNWLCKNQPFRQLLELAFERALFSPLDPGRPVMPLNELQLSQRLVANMRCPRMVGRSALLTIGDRWVLNDALPTDCRQQWELVFASDLDGKSWNTFLHRLQRSGATLVVVSEKGTDHIFGGFASADWNPQPQFYGDSTNFLFTIRPELRTYPTSGFNKHYQYLNQGTQTLPNGLGMGGQLGYCGLWIDPSFELGASYAGPLCSTYNSPRLSYHETFHIASVEVWQVRPSPCDSDDEEGGARPKRSAMDAHPDAVALLEMANRKMYASLVRDPDLEDDSPRPSQGARGSSPSGRHSIGWE
ncbi:hypothetical protein IWQ61_008468 [Dispira simplex]|nr:hypothetical protein IWQ61_008468 [Dispira simplex]